MHLYPKERLAVCTTRQVNADRLERFVLENLKRVSRDEPYIENLCFRLNHNPDDLVRNSLIKNRVAGDRWNSKERKSKYSFFLPFRFSSKGKSGSSN